MEDEIVNVRINAVVEMPGGGLKLVLVEGPWSDDDAVNLARMSKRISDCVTAAATGHLAERFPQSNGQPLTIHIDSYSTPKQAVDSMLEYFRRTVSQGAVDSRFVSAISFTHRWIDFDEEFDRRMRADEASYGFFAQFKSWLSKLMSR